MHTNISYPVHNRFFAFGQILLMRKAIAIYHYVSAQLLPDYNILVNKIYFASKKLLVSCHLYFAEPFMEYYMFLMRWFIMSQIPFFGVKTAKAVNNFCLFQVLALMKLISVLNGLNQSFPNVAITEIFWKIFGMATCR